MGLLDPVPPPYDPLDWLTKPLAERGRMVCQAWAMQGYGSPAAVFAVYGSRLRPTSGCGCSFVHSPKGWASCHPSAGLVEAICRLGSREDLEALLRRRRDLPTDDSVQHRLLLALCKCRIHKEMEKLASQLTPSPAGPAADFKLPVGPVPFLPFGMRLLEASPNWAPLPILP